MRTTYTPEPDLEAKLREIARSKKASLNSVINEAVRAGLYGEKPVERKGKRFEVQPVDLGLIPGIDPLKLRDVLNDLDTQER